MARARLAATVRVVRGAIRSPALRRVMLAFLLFAAVEFGTWIAVLLYAYDAVGPGAIGLVAVVQLVPSAAFAGVATTVADRFPRHRVLLAGYAFQAATMSLTAIGMLAGWAPVLVIAAAAAAGCAMALTRPAHWALLPLLARTPEELTAANGVAGSVEGAGGLIGSVAASFVLALGEPGTVFAVGAIAVGGSALLVARLPVRAGRAPAAVEASSGDGDEGTNGERPGGAPRISLGARTAWAIRAIGGRRDTRIVVLLLAAYAFVAGATDVLFVLLSLDVLGIGDSGAAALGAAWGLGSILGGVAAFTLVGRRRLAPVMVAGGLLLGASCLVVGLVPGAFLAALVVAVGGLGGTALDIAGRTTLQRVAEPRTLTQVLGTLEGLGILAMAVGSLAAPAIAAAAGVPVALAVTGLVLPASLGLLWASLAAIDRKVRVPVRELALLRADRILSPLPAPKLEAVASGARWVTLDPGETLISEGEPGDRYYVLESGSIRVSRQGTVLREAESDRGYGLGEIALLRDVPRTATVVATAPSVLLAIGRPEFLEAVTGHEQAGAAALGTADAREPIPGTA